MDVIKRILFFLFFIPLVTFGQKKQYPKDTIYIKYENKKENKKWFGDYGYGNNKKTGILFNLKDINNKSISLFFNKSLKADSLSIKHLKEYKFSNLKEIRKKEIARVDRKYAKSKYKPYTGGGLRNGSFQTYLIEIISKEKFVIYPVIWRNDW